MLQSSVAAILSKLTPQDLVLDVGGWACPFNRAQWVLDAEPFASRGFYKSIGMPGSQGGEREWFSKDTWVQRDICAREPWPFADKQFDFVICSHTLEDVRDPLWVCSELMRVGKQGYIEVPSREMESCRGVERPGQVGLSHHRWLVEIEGDKITFLQKYHLIHAHWRFSFPRSHAFTLSPDRAVACLWWADSFAFAEKTLHGVEALENELENYVARIRPYSRWKLTIDRLRRRATRELARVQNKLGRSLRYFGPR